MFNRKLGSAWHAACSSLRVIQMSLSIRSQSSRISELIEALRSVMRPAQLDRGCASARLYSEIGNPECLNYVEEWRSESDLKRNLRSERFVRLIAIMEIAAGPPELNFSQVIESDGLEFVSRICREADSGR